MIQSHPPSQDRLIELFDLQDGILIRRSVDRETGWTDANTGIEYVTVDKRKYRQEVVIYCYRHGYYRD